MNETLKVYGFGSAFRGSHRPQDVDLLLVHQSTERSSCDFAIECKRFLQRHLPHVDVVMLSALEARDHDFIERASAVLLGTIAKDQCEAQLGDLTSRISTPPQGVANFRKIAKIHT